MVPFVPQGIQRGRSCLLYRQEQRVLPPRHTNSLVQAQCTGRHCQTGTPPPVATGMFVTRMKEEEGGRERLCIPQTRLEPPNSRRQASLRIEARGILTLSAFVNGHEQKSRGFPYKTHVDFTTLGLSEDGVVFFRLLEEVLPIYSTGGETRSSASAGNPGNSQGALLYDLCLPSTTNNHTRHKNHFILPV